jgi:WD40 repeat protein
MFTGVGAVEVYDASNYQKIYAYTGQAAGGNGVIFNNEGTLLATPNADGTVGIWDMTNGRELFTLLGHANGVGDAAFSPGCVQSPFPQCSQYLVTASRDKTIKIWDVTPAGNREVVTVPGSVTFFNPADKRLVTGTLNDDLTTMTYHLWDITTMGDQREVASFPVTHPVRIYDGSYSFDSALVGTVSVDGTVKILDLGTGAETLTFTPPEPIVSAIDVSIPASGPRLTAISPNKELTVWDAMTGKKLATLPQLYDIVTTVSFSPDGNQMVIVSEESPTATLWDIQSGKKLFDLAGHTQPLYYSVFSQDGKRMATVGKDGIAMVWDAQTGKRLFTLAGHSASIQAAVFSKDGTRLATGGVDGIAKVWDIPDDPNAGKELLDLSGYSPYIFTMDFKPDGRYLATSSFGEGITRVYALQIEDLIAIARSRLTRSMTPEECKKYLHRTTCP